MLLEVDARDRETWRSLGNAISRGLQLELQTTPVGDRIRALLGEQVELIRSIPIDAGKRVHELTLKGLADSTRFTAHVAEIKRSGDVAQSRAVLIARTEVSRTASVLTEARARHTGGEEYFWRTAGDKDVRQSHREMANKVVRWDSPPTLDGLQGHAGCLPNCRCYPEPVIPSD